MPDHDPERVRVRKGDAERLLACTLTMVTLTSERAADARQRARTAAVLAQQSRSRMRAAMWLAHSRG